jgi:hypothetical protein
VNEIDPPQRRTEGPVPAVVDPNIAPRGTRCCAAAFAVGWGYASDRVGLFESFKAIFVDRWLNLRKIFRRLSRAP